MAEAPLVGVIMGSDSDLPCMAAACEKLKQFGVRPSELCIFKRGAFKPRVVGRGS